MFIPDPDYFFFLGSNNSTKEVEKKEISCQKNTGSQTPDPIRRTDLVCVEVPFLAYFAAVSMFAESEEISCLKKLDAVFWSPIIIPETGNNVVLPVSQVHMYR
jgi:hypothetical protein